MTASETERFRAWLGRGVEIEAFLYRLVGEHPTAVAAAVAALREVMVAWVKTRDVLLATAQAATMIRALAWASDVTLLDAAGWALGPYRWCPP